MTFSLIFANQPIDHKTLIIHTAPFILLEIVLVFGQIAVVMFGKLVAWKKVDKEEPIPLWFTNVAIVHVVLMGVITMIKICLQVSLHQIVEDLETTSFWKKT